ncbi:MAG: glutamine--fructose-6-phosphate transaminase (isomerizing) [Candidatus Saccharimonadales bacterium]
MCGIVGYVGPKASPKIIIDGLKALEYRGYDSAGLAVITKDHKATLLKEAGRVQELEKLITTAHLGSSVSGIGHTRWATHGAPTVNNAHPHTNSDKTIFVVHNGIIENYLDIKKRLTDKGYAFVTDTDTEVIPQLIDYYYKKTASFEEAFKATIKDLKGAYSIVAITTYEPDKLFAARLSSPLVLGIGKDEMFIASDPNALMKHTNQIVYVEDDEIVVINKKSYHLVNLNKQGPVNRKVELLNYDVTQASLGQFPHFMLKEIFEIPQIIQLATAGRVHAISGTLKLGGLELVGKQLDRIERIVIVACGTAYYAGLVGEYLIEELAGIPVEVQIASEFRYRDEPFSRGTALLAISQSGETADTIAALKKVEDYGVLRLGVVNVVGSTVARMTDAGVYCHAGPEQAVASTKAFIAQVIVLLQIALGLSRGKHKLYKPLLTEIEALPGKTQILLNQAGTIERLVKKYSQYHDFLFMGRRYGYPCALEGALKLKEVSYIHAEGFASGETKHGPIAMIDQNFPTLAIATDSDLMQKIYSNIEEIKARRGPILAIATEGNKVIQKLVDDTIFIPKTLEQTAPILQTIPMQLFAYYMALEKGFDVDKPRNLAKSVTVE